jgi:hypothetical protein
VISEISTGGVISTLAGSGTDAYVNGTGTGASFQQIGGIAVDSTGNVYVADSGNYVIRKITPGGVVTTLAGSGNGVYADGTGTAASFCIPQGITVDANGYLYVSDVGCNRIRLITPGGVVTTLAGSGAEGAANGTGTAASFYQPWGIMIDSYCHIYVGDRYTELIREIQ